jgi:hypothetical protein
VPSKQIAMRFIFLAPQPDHATIRLALPQGQVRLI